MRLHRIFCIAMLLSSLTALQATAQTLDVYPTINPTVTAYSPEDNDTITMYPGDAEVKSFDAPFTITLHANPENADDWTVDYEWRFFLEGGSADAPIFRREGETWTEIIKSTGTYNIVLYAYFKDKDGNIVYEYGEGDEPIIFNIKKSKLEFPNAFSPNGDGINDYYGAKSSENCECRGKEYCIHRGQSIVKFHADIFSRWGQKLYSWDDVTHSWDGKFHGTLVKNGVYFVRVQAEGADGTKYNIRKDVNVLTGYTEKESSAGGE